MEAEKAPANPFKKRRVEQPSGEQSAEQSLLRELKRELAQMRRELAKTKDALAAKDTENELKMATMRQELQSEMALQISEAAKDN